MPDTPRLTKVSPHHDPRRDGEVIAVPEAWCPDCRHSLTPDTVQVAWPNVWALHCPMDGQHFEYREVQ